MSAKDFAAEAEIALASQLAHRVEVDLLLTRIERLTAVCKEHGLPIPGDDRLLGMSDGDHLELCRVVVSKAYDALEACREFEEALAALKSAVGSGMELVGGKRWMGSR